MSGFQFVEEHRGPSNVTWLCHSCPTVNTHNVRRPSPHAGLIRHRCVTAARAGRSPWTAFSTTPATRSGARAVAAARRVQRRGDDGRLRPVRVAVHPRRRRCSTMPCSMITTGVRRTAGSSPNASSRSGTSTPLRSRAHPTWPGRPPTRRPGTSPRREEHGKRRYPPAPRCAASKTTPFHWRTPEPSKSTGSPAPSKE